MNLNHTNMDPRKVQRRLEKARTHLKFVVSLYREQLDAGLHFLHEHPATATSWQSEVMKPVLDDPRVQTVEGHMCRQGMRLPDREGAE